MAVIVLTACTLACPISTGVTMQMMRYREKGDN